MTRATLILALGLSACMAAPDSEADSTSDDTPTGASPTSVEYGDLGTVRLTTGCGDAAHPLVERGLALLHHMTYLDARESFAAAVEADPACGFGYWGQAMTYIHPLWPDVPSTEDLDRGRQLVERGREAAASDTRAADYLSTVEAYFRDATDRTEPERLASFAAAWAQVRDRHPDDLEARALSALALLATVSPSDKTYAGQYEALDLLDDVLEAIPDHPGGQHYVIHARDYPPLAEDALDVARAYGRLAPDVPHALHMPTHIYTRVGLWDESIEGNDRSAESSWRRTEAVGGISTDFHHALDYLAYAHLQRAEDESARAVMERALAADGPWAAANMPAIAYALAAIPARYALERRDWNTAADLAPRAPDGFPWDDGFAPFEALTHFARALGGARSGRFDVAEEAIGTLEALGERISSTSSNEYWRTQIEVQVVAARAWLAHERGDRDRGLDLMREAARVEASTEKGPVTPGELLPAAELLGEMLFLAGRYDEALDAYEAALARSPNRLNGLAGAAKAARAAGRDDAAQRYLTALIDLTASAETPRPAIEEARAYVEEVSQ
ncbi:MAG: tetratricopeptide repeat protein [Gemmatimonadota bacterium]|nr:tetratricopeptide repeat protein [Gemmatimonadota bacterium]